MRLGKLEIKARNWPWHVREAFWANPPDKTGKLWGWKVKTWGMGRFGGGWHWKLGVAVGEKSVIIDLILGSIRINWGS